MFQGLERLCLLSFLILTLGCAQQRPVFYPSPYLKTVGQERAEADINDCIRLASEHGAKGDAGEQVAKDTTEGGGAVALWVQEWALY